MICFCESNGYWGLPWWLNGKESACQCRRQGLDSWVGKIPWRRKRQPTAVFLPEKSQEQRNLMGFSSWGCKRVEHDLATKQQQWILRNTVNTEKCGQDLNVARNVMLGSKDLCSPALSHWTSVEMNTGLVSEYEEILPLNKTQAAAFLGSLLPVHSQPHKRTRMAMQLECHCHHLLPDNCLIQGIHA